MRRHGRHRVQLRAYCTGRADAAPHVDRQRADARQWRGVVVRRPGNSPGGGAGHQAYDQPVKPDKRSGTAGGATHQSEIWVFTVFNRLPQRSRGVPTRGVGRKPAVPAKIEPDRPYGGSGHRGPTASLQRASQRGWTKYYTRRSSVAVEPVHVPVRAELEGARPREALNARSHRQSRRRLVRSCTS